MLKVRSRCDTPPALTSDGYGGHREALLAVYGQVPPYGGRGRPPTEKRPAQDWQYLQMVKQREQGRVVGIVPRVIYGDEAQGRARLGEHTAYVERTHLTSRLMNGRLVRKTLGFSKELAMLEASCIWEDLVYNFARPLKTLRAEVQAISPRRAGAPGPNGEGHRRWQRRSPAMAAGITDHVWTIVELLTRVPVPNNS